MHIWKRYGKKEQDIRGEVKTEIQCLIRGYGLLDDEDSVEKVLELVRGGDSYLDNPSKSIRIPGGRLKRRQEEEALRMCETVWRWSRTKQRNVI